MTRKKSRHIPLKIKEKVKKRDYYKCTSCGKSPSTYPEITLEVDHILPFSKGGSHDLENLQTLCNECNKGKGNNEDLNITVKDKIYILLDKINPKILEEINSKNIAKVVANDFDYMELERLNELYPIFIIQATTNYISGYQSGYNLGIYTIKDNNAGKVNFILKVK